MRYTIVDTWNGEGYSDSGVIGHADNPTEANKKANEFFQEAYLSQINIGFGNSEFEIEVVDGESLSFYDGQDAGCVHVLETTDAYGLCILPDDNGVIILDTEEDYDNAVATALETAEGDEEKEEFINGSNGIHTDLGYEIIIKL